MPGYATPSGSAQNNRTTNFWTYRWLGGPIRLRLLDVAWASDPNYNWGQWGQAEFRVELIGRDGKVKAGNTFYKTWGVKPAYKTLVTWNTAQEVRMRITPHVTVSRPDAYSGWVNFKMEMSWG